MLAPDVRTAPQAECTAAADAFAAETAVRTACAFTRAHYGQRPCWEASSPDGWQACADCTAVAIWHATEVVGIGRGR